MRIQPKYGTGHLLSQGQLPLDRANLASLSPAVAVILHTLCNRVGKWSPGPPAHTTIRIRDSSVDNRRTTSVQEVNRGNISYGISYATSQRAASYSELPKHPRQEPCLPGGKSVPPSSPPLDMRASKQSNAATTQPCEKATSTRGSCCSHAGIRQTTMTMVSLDQRVSRSTTHQVWMLRNASTNGHNGGRPLYTSCEQARNPSHTARRRTLILKPRAGGNVLISFQWQRVGRFHKDGSVQRSQGM